MRSTAATGGSSLAAICARFGALTVPFRAQIAAQLAHRREERPHVIDKHVDPRRRGKRTLTATCEHYGVRRTDAHDATGDALAAARLAWTLTERHPDILQVDPTELHQAQIGWRRDQAESLARYFVRQGRPDDVARDWPIQERR